MLERTLAEVFSPMKADSQEKLARCQEILRRLRRVVVALSGGVDSTFLLALASETLGKDNVLAVVGVSASLADRELQDARRLAGHVGVRLVEIQTGEMDDARYTANPANRCFYCKSELFAKLKALADREGFPAIVSGANADDTGDFRPGLAAGEQMGIASPLLAAGLTKADIRAAAKAMGLPVWNKPAYACLSSRVPYGQAITPEKLSRIERAEAVLHELGFASCRVRDHGTIARVEVPAEDIQAAAAQRERIVEPLKAMGYAYVTLDLQGFRSGSMNETL